MKLLSYMKTLLEKSKVRCRAGSGVGSSKIKCRGVHSTAQCLAVAELEDKRRNIHCVWCV